MGAGSRELEALVPLGDDDADAGRAPPDRPAGAPPRPRRRRWPVVAIAVVLVAAGVAVPLRDWLVRRELAWLDRQWLAAAEDEAGRITAQQHLEAYLQVGEANQVYPAVAALYRAQRVDLLSLAARLQRAVLVDGGLTNLRGQMVAALDHQATLLAQVAVSFDHGTDDPVPPFPPEQDQQSQAEDVRVDNGLASEQGHWHEPQSPSPPPASYPAATAVLARLARWLDQPTGVVLLAGALATSSQLARLDVDASRVTTTAVPTDGSPTPRQGYLAYVARGAVWAVAPAGTGTPRMLARADWLSGAEEPAAIWVEDGSTNQVREIDGTGRVLFGPRVAPGVVVAATAAGLVVTFEDRPGFEVWNPVDGQVGCRMEGAVDAATLAAHGDLLAWLGGDADLHVTNLASCADVLRESDDLGDMAQSNAAFNPDGRYLALSWAAVNDDGAASFPFVLLNTASGQLANVPNPDAATGPAAGPVGGIAWSPDGRRLFWLYPSAGADPALIWAWTVGDPTSGPLHAVSLQLSGPLYAAPRP